MKHKKPLLVTEEAVGFLIHTVRGVRAILDTDLAKLYDVPTFRLNEAVRRNRVRFPADFLLELSGSLHKFTNVLFGSCRQG